MHDYIVLVQQEVPLSVARSTYIGTDWILYEESCMKHLTTLGFYKFHYAPSIA